MARDFKALERRRIRAARLLGKGYSQAEVALELSVSRQSVSRWHRQWKEAGREGLKAAGRAGPLPRLAPAQEDEVEAVLLRGPERFG